MKKHYMIWILVGFLAMLAVWSLGARWIGERGFEMAAARLVGTDPSADLGDGLHVYVCGSGSPLPDAERAGPCLAVLAGEHGFIFDVGSGSMRKLGRMGFPMDRLEATFLTHLHSDHIDGFGEMMLQAWMAGRRDKPLPVYGPPGTDRVASGFMEAYALDRGYRIAHHGPKVARPGGFGAKAVILDWDQLSTDDWDGSIYEEGGIRISMERVDHSPVDFAYAYRIEYQGRSAIISGDTKYLPELANFSQGADVIFHEALNPAMVSQIGAALADRGNMDGAKIMADIPDYHSSPEDAARIAQSAGAGALVLYHLVPAPPTRLVEPAFLGDAPKLFDGIVELGEDGMVVSLPANNEQITIEQVL